MATVSRQSAFWAIVALGLNTFTQPGGKVLGFPAQYSRALRLSPIVCIVDTLVVLFSVAFFAYQTRSFKDGIRLAARYRCLTEDDTAEPKLERTWWFRFSVFALGALPQAVKVLGMGGVTVTKVWGMAYLVSFLVLEGLDLLQPRQHRDYHALEPYATMLDTYIGLSGHLAVLTQHLSLFLQFFIISSKLYPECGIGRGSYPPQSGRAAHALINLGLTACWALVLLTGSVAGYLVMNKFAIHRPFLGAVMHGTQTLLWTLACSLPLSATTVFYGVEPICEFNPALAQILAIDLLLTTVALPFLLNDLAYEEGWFRQTPFLIRWFRELFGLEHSERLNRNFSLLFAILSIESIIYYYMYLYDPSNTYKPPWTEYLG